MQVSRKSHLIIQFSKEPKLGQVKTRLSSVLNATQRNQLHCQLTQWTSQQLQQLGNLELWVAGDIENPFFKHLSQEYSVTVREQRGENLGERMSNAFEDGIARAEKVIIVGSDCPFISADYFQQALNALKEADVVLGPANDGGYVLIGLRQLQPQLFEGINWGSDTVLNETLAKLNRSQASYSLLESLSDIDRPEDLKALAVPQLPQTLREFAKLKP